MTIQHVGIAADSHTGFLGRMPVAAAAAVEASLFAVVDEIEALRRKAGLTVTEFASKAKRPFQSYTNWKKRRHPPDLQGLQAFAVALGMCVRVTLYDPTSVATDNVTMALTPTERRILGMLRRMTPEEQQSALEAVADLLDPNEPAADNEGPTRSRQTHRPTT